MDEEVASNKDSVTVRLIRMILDMPEEQQLSLLKGLEKTLFQAEKAGKRDNTRKPYSKPVQFIVKGRSYSGTIQDISPGGLFIRTTESFSVGDAVKVTIPMSDDQRRVTTLGEIVRITQDGIGVMFKKSEE